MAESAASPTQTHRGDPPARPAPTVRSPSGSSAEGRFLPGTLLAGRYRVFGIVGRGGMGEVYRADDLKLGQTVALKFLPTEVERDPARLSRFLDEVRIARQISHPNVCRVYDAAEVDGHTFLSMEFVDGEDLASLLRRIGRIPKDKAIQIARQLCAGLAAAHEQGVLHRDLKPSNVMIDGRGRARITDFGLARLAGEIHGADIMAGTPAYMAPEQIAGEGVTARSDLYSLGLVLYELFTGQPAFKGSTPAELARLKSETAPANPAQIVEGFDPAVERVILRCLEREPANRPASALMVAAAMPGGDPLAAALAAGETPSPEMVAEAGAVGGLTAVAGWACLAALALAIVLVVLAAGRSQLARLVPLEMPPEVLADRARQVIRELGYRDPPADTAFGFEADDDYLSEVARGANTPQKWSRLRTGPPFAVNFWYRQSLQPLSYLTIAQGPSFDDPPSLISGMVGVRLDPEGRLRLLEVAPPERESSGTVSPAPEPDWSILLRQAGLDPGALRVVEPVWFPAMFADRRAAWEGAYPATPGAGATPVRIEAASLRGRPVAFRIVEPWTRPLRMAAVAPGGWQKAEQYVLIVVAVAIMAGGVLLARRNMLLGRGDRRGAFRLAAVLLTAVVVTWIVRAHHVGGGDEVWRFLFRVGDGLVFASLVWIFYLALEPYLRRLWPRLIVSWVRLLDGRLRDPLVGRDVLLGLLGGTLYALLNRLTIIGPGWLGLPSIRPDQVPGPPVEMFILTGLRSSAGIVLSLLAGSLVVAMGILVLLLLARIALRRTWLAILVVTVALSLSGFFATGNPYVDVCLGSLIAIVPVSILFRVGVLAMVTAQFACQILSMYPMTFDTSSWLFGDTFLALAVVAALTVYGFRVALAGRPALGGPAAPGGG